MKENYLPTMQKMLEVATGWGLGQGLVERGEWVRCPWCRRIAGSIISPSREKAPLLSSTPMQSPQARHILGRNPQIPHWSKYMVNRPQKGRFSYRAYVNLEKVLIHAYTTSEHRWQMASWSLLLVLVYHGPVSLSPPFGSGNRHLLSPECKFQIHMFDHFCWRGLLKGLC